MSAFILRAIEWQFYGPNRSWHVWQHGEIITIQLSQGEKHIRRELTPHEAQTASFDILSAELEIAKGLLSA